MKIAWFRKVISPEVGACVAGYGLYQKSVTKSDDLYMCGLCVDDGNNRILIISFDLLGLDHWYSSKIRAKCAEILHIPVSSVMLSCTHTHSGPESRTLGREPAMLNREYLANLETMVCEEVAGLKDFRECKTAFYSIQCDENRNRRYVTADNCASFLPHRKEMTRIADGFADKELGAVYFLGKNGEPIYAIGNYAAHPLAGHAPGIGGLRISADYPGAFRNYITSETGAEAMFISGAAGDMVPKDDELGMDSVQRMGINLAKAAIMGIIDAQRNPARFIFKDPKVGSCSKSFTSPIRRKYRGHLPEEYNASDTVTLEIQCVSIGDVCFVGVPGELCAELGQEIKWHSPFRRTLLAYCSTAYFGYICPANFIVSGGYEGDCHFFSARDSITLLKTAVDAMFELRDSVFPDDAKREEPYPDFLNPPLINIPANR